MAHTHTHTHTNRHAHKMMLCIWYYLQTHSIFIRFYYWLFLPNQATDQQTFFKLVYYCLRYESLCFTNSAVIGPCPQTWMGLCTSTYKGSCYEESKEVWGWLEEHFNFARQIQMRVQTGPLSCISIWIRTLVLWYLAHDDNIPSIDISFSNNISTTQQNPHQWYNVRDQTFIN